MMINDRRWKCGMSYSEPEELWFGIGSSPQRHAGSVNHKKKSNLIQAAHYGVLSGNHSTTAGFVNMDGRAR
jgi:hypothetical protein